jgi:hypothetical protein
VAALYEPRLVPPRIPVQVNPTVLSQHVGRYRLAGGGMLTVDLRDAGLHMQIDAPRADALLQPESPTSFLLTAAIRVCAMSSAASRTNASAESQLCGATTK